MADPVILIGLDWADGKLAVVGLYATLKDAQDAIGLDLPTGKNYAVMTPKLGSFVEPRPFPDMARR